MNESRFPTFKTGMTKRPESRCLKCDKTNLLKTDAEE